MSRTHEFFRNEFERHYRQSVIAAYSKKIRGFSPTPLPNSEYAEHLEKGDFKAAVLSARKYVWDWFLREAYFSKTIGNSLAAGFETYEPQALSPYGFYAELNGQGRYVTGWMLDGGEFVPYTSEFARELKFGPSTEKTTITIENAKLIETKPYLGDVFVEFDTASNDSPKRPKWSAGLKNVGLSLSEDQDGFMRALPEENVVITGPAGSWKTNVLLHRLDYLDREMGIEARWSASFCLRPWLRKYLAESARSILSDTPSVWSFDAFVTSALEGMSSIPLPMANPVADTAEFPPGFNDLCEWLEEHGAERAKKRIRPKGTGVEADIFGLWEDWKERAQLIGWGGLDNPSVRAGLLLVCRRVGKLFVPTGRPDWLAFLRYRHVVVDEFQDFSPWQIRMLAEWSAGGITIAGDVTQSVFSNPVSWEFEFGIPIDRILRLEASHRSTIQNIAFAKHVLEEGQNYIVANKAAFVGDLPVAFETDDASFAEYLSSKYESEKEKTFLIACQDIESANRWNRKLMNFGVSSYVASGEDWDFTRRLAIAEYREVKGLEFDYVFIMDLPEFMSDATVTNRKNIAYTVLTRARERIFAVSVNDTGTLEGFLGPIPGNLYERWKSIPWQGDIAAE